MTETNWRYVAELVRGHLHEIVRDAARAAELDGEISALLAGPDDPAARRRLRAVLSGHPGLRAWVNDLVHRAPPGVRMADGDPADPFRLDRYLAAEIPARIRLGARFPVQVMIVIGKPDMPHARLPVLPGTGPRTVTVTVSAPNLQPTGDLEQELVIPVERDSDPVRFGFVARRPGTHKLTIRAFHGGTFLGELLLSVAAESDVSSTGSRVHHALLSRVEGQPGDVTLQLLHAGGQHYIQLLDGHIPRGHEPLGRPAGEMTGAANALRSQLRTMAANPKQFTSPEQAQRALAARGAALWVNAVPERIRQAFWEQADRITSLVVAADDDIVPWELLYARDPTGELGFLAEHYPVIRRLTGQADVRTLGLGSASYVVPPGSPSDAVEEIRQVRSRLGLDARHGDLVSDLAVLRELVEDPASVPALLHFACHNTFVERSGSLIEMGGGPFQPEDLTPAASHQTLASARPLVFLNACRSAGQTPFFGGTMGWATQFVKAGAAAFVGTHWTVRSSSASVFAVDFYQGLVDKGLSLGAAMLAARRSAAAAMSGDPTWLAYAVYGDAATTAAPGPGHTRTDGGHG